ncbi:MAG: hypothetical protein GY696_10520, partial [Gammaproteobacteria bacterium]|nr:hypothetical protein [Gammaproteobacteria bacterium]
SAGTDYTALTGTVDVADGQQTASIDVSGIIDDALLENDETVIVTLTGSSDAAVSVDATPITVTITDNDNTAGSVDANLTVSTHGDEAGPTSIVYTVTLAAVNNTGSAITFDSAFSGGTAIAADYTDVSGVATISVADGASTGTLSVPVIDDALLEATETLELTISNASDAAINIATASASANITDAVLVEPEPEPEPEPVPSDTGESVIQNPGSLMDAHLSGSTLSGNSIKISGEYDYSAYGSNDSNGNNNLSFVIKAATDVAPLGADMTIDQSNPVIETANKIRSLGDDYHLNSKTPIVDEVERISAELQNKDKAKIQSDVTEQRSQRLGGSFETQLYAARHKFEHGAGKLVAAIFNRKNSG